MNALADNARARDIGAGVEQAWNPVDEDFMDRLDAAGVPTTDSDRTLHAAYRREALARGLVPTLDALDDVDAAIADVVRAMRLALSKMPKPQSSTPQLLLTTRKSATPVA